MFDVESQESSHTEVVGVDLGVKTLAKLSIGDVVWMGNYFLMNLLLPIVKYS
jgi:transposase